MSPEAFDPERAIELHAATAEAVACAGRIFYRPERVVATLITLFGALPEHDYPGDDGVTHACYEHAVRVGGTLGVFSLRPLHWPMLNLLDAADRDRRAFGAAMASAVRAARNAHLPA